MQCKKTPKFTLHMCLKYLYMYETNVQNFTKYRSYPTNKITCETSGAAEGINDWGGFQKRGQLNS